MHRRYFTGTLLALPWLAQAQPDALEGRLRAGACVLLMRHASTDPGIGDPLGFRLDKCSTQRNLSSEGRAHAERIAQWFTSRGLEPGAVKSSAWCRCKDTADLAFGRHKVWPALNSFFVESRTRNAQTAQLRTVLKRIPAGTFEVWVTHQVNITALTGEGMAMGEALVLDVTGIVRARSNFS